IAQGCERILVMPLYPQYSAATTATVCDEVFRVLMELRRQPTLRVAAPYYDDKVYIQALASSMREELGKLSFQPEIVLASYHGMPEEYVRKGDPYERQCIETTRLLREALGYDESKLMLTFQSRFGRAKWVAPATDQTVKKLAKSGVKNLAVITPGFSADCLETIEELGIRGRETFLSAGGTHFARLDCLNASKAGIAMLERLVARELEGWLPAS
ncbi:MAG: ferrochelatase, partial [Sphingomicrobium sp.]